MDICPNSAIADRAVGTYAGILASAAYRGMPSGLVEFSFVIARAVSTALLRSEYEMNILKHDTKNAS